MFNFKTSNIATAIKTVLYGERDRHIDEENMKENLEIDAHKYAQVTFHKTMKTIQWQKVASSTDGTGATGYP